MKKYDYLILAGGRCPPLLFLKRILKISKAVVTVDRGAQMAQKLGITPQWHFGDNDSVSPRILKRIQPKMTVTLPAKKAVSDLEYALSSLPKDATKLIIGSHQDHEGRADHVFVNLCLASRWENTYLADERIWITSISSGGIVFSVPKNTVFSLVSPGKATATITGAEYPIRSGKLRSPSQGLSNVAKKRWVRVKIHGVALLFVSSNILKAKIRR